ncbi:MAG: hypothetical protein KUG75_05025 [Pseudomonadales bacterium]|nr:hypothetical protein [Pseudomonadales bacterium]
MHRIVITILFACLTSLTVSRPSAALEMPDYLANTPVGSWVTMELATQRGRKSEIMHTTQSLVGEEMVDGQRYLWLEIKTQIFKVSKKGKRKQKGETTYVKMLSDASLFKGNASNVMANLRKLAKKMYIKTGDNVMDLSGGGAMANAMLQGAGTNFEFNITDLKENKELETPLGNVTAHRYRGVGDAQVKILIKTIKTHSDADMWLSTEVPFGMVEMNSVTTVNGKQETSSSKIIAAGLSGAESEVDISTAQENPMNALFGGN